MNEENNNSVVNNENVNTDVLTNVEPKKNEFLNEQSVQQTPTVENKEVDYKEHPTSSAKDFHIDPSTITVGPEVINQQIPVDNQNFTNQPVNNIVSNENKTANGPSKKSNNFSLILVFILFVAVGAFIWFMPEIRQMMNHNKKEQVQTPVQEEKKENEQTTPSDNFDSFVCTRVGSTYTLYSQNSLLKKYNLALEHTSDIERNYKDCLTLQQSEVNGFLVGCEKTTNSVSVIKTFDFTVLPDSFTNEDMKLKKDTNIKTIQSKLETEGYTCG